MINLLGYTFLTTTYSGRIPLCIATIAGVMSKVKGAEFVIMWCDEPDSSRYLQHMLQMIATATGNELTFCQAGSDTSVAHTKRAFTPSTKMTHFINLDDDLLVTERSLTFLKGLPSVPVVTIGVVDADGSRGFEDYDNYKYPSYAAFLEFHSPGKAKHHSFAYSGALREYGWISQLYCMTRETYENLAVWDTIYDRFKQKGVRGYDIVLENNLQALGIKSTLIFGCEALHIGLEHAYLGGPWTGADDITKTVVTLKG